MGIETRVYEEVVPGRVLAAPHGDRSGAPDQGVELALSPGASLRDLTRLVILIPKADLLAGWWKPIFSQLNVSIDTEIALVALSRPGGRERAERRRLGALLGPIRQEFPRASSRLLHQPGWQSALQTFVREGDVLVCFPEHSGGSDLAGRRAFTGVLGEAITVPVIEVSGVYPPAGQRLWQMARRGLFNLFPLAVVGLFFWVQMQVSQRPHDLAYMLTLGGLAVAELGVIFVWSLSLG